MEPENTNMSQKKYQVTNDEIISESTNEAQLEPVSIRQHEFDCPLCYQLLYEPITLECGHTFCRDCCYQALQRKNHCPLCRKHTQIDAIAHPSNVLITKLLQKYNTDAYETRAKRIQRNANLRRPRHPIFVSRFPEYPNCKLSLYIYEAKYRIMVNRIINADSKFIIAYGTTPQSPHYIGVLCHLKNCSTITDGRSLISTDIIKRVKLGNIESENDSFGLLSAEIEDYLDIDTTQNNRNSDDNDIMNIMLTSFEKFIGSKKQRFYESIGPSPTDLTLFSLWIAGAWSRCFSASGGTDAKITNVQLQILESQSDVDRLKLIQNLATMILRYGEKKSKMQFWIVLCVIALAVAYGLFNWY